jgi:surface antigen
MPHGTCIRLTLVSVLGLLVSLVLAACTSEINLGSKPEATGSTPAASGGISGGVLSGAIGGNLGEQDRQRAYAAEVQALESGEPGIPVGWRGDGPKRYGTVVPGAPYSARGTRCRDYSHSIYVDGKPQIARGTAYRNADGSWAPVG